MSNLANGVRSPEWYRAVYSDASVSGIVAVGTGGVGNVIAALSALHAIFVQKITITITGTADAHSVTFQDDASTPVVAYVLEASAALGTIRTVDYGARGFKLTDAKNLDIVNTAGPVYSYAIDAYQKQTLPGQSTTINRTI